MIKFFRHIRKDLMEQNKTGKYLKYAIGEISLVVIGILIALWINNVSQNYKNEQLARTYLFDFKRDIEADIKTLDERILKNLKQIQNIDSIISYTKGRAESVPKTKFYPWVTNLMFESYFVPEKTTIRQFESSNSSHLITYKVLKDKLFTYYNANDLNENNMERSVQLYQHNYLTKDLWKVYQPAYANRDLATSTILINNLRADYEFMSAIDFKRGLTAVQKNKYFDLKGMAEEIVKLINSELE